MPPRVLLTGFEPFDSAEHNASWHAVESLAAAWRGDAELVTVRLPVVFGQAGDAVAAAIQAHRPGVVVAVGLAEGRADVTPERIAINVRDARMADNAGGRPVDEPIDAEGPAGYFSTLPLRPILDHLSAAGIPAKVSDTAGTFVCNDVFYRVMAQTRSSYRAGHHIQAGFVHLPQATEYARHDEPTLPLETLARSLKVVVNTCLARMA